MALTEVNAMAALPPQKPTAMEITPGGNPQCRRRPAGEDIDADKVQT
jgi:hypothetical protein